MVAGCTEFKWLVKLVGYLQSSTFQTPLGGTLSTSAKQPLEPYQMELGPHLSTSQQVPVPSDMVPRVV